MKKLTLLPFLLFLGFATIIWNNVHSQIAHGGQPYQWKVKSDIPSDIISLPSFNIDSLLTEDSITEQYKDIPFRFAYGHKVNLDISNSGSFINIKKGRIWRLRVNSPGAHSLNITFDRFNLTDGASLFIYNARKDYFIGSFTKENNNNSNTFGTTPVPGDDIIIELFEPNANIGKSSLSISTIAHDYKGVFHKIAKNFGGSGSCNINTVCSQGIGWENQIKSVALITLSNGTRICSGSLLNNELQDGTPYFLTANHCIDAFTSTWVFIFGYESATCNPSQNGSTLNSISGCNVRASNAGSDFALLELSSVPPIHYNVYYAGWDNSGTQPANQTAIHHPSGDVKKISKDLDTASQLIYSGMDCWEVGSWEEGTTEGGSSGSPLFDQNKRVIGQLYGGSAACGNSLSDYYGRVFASWNGTDSSNRLNDWLDPNNTGITTINGYAPSPAFALDLYLENVILSNSTCHDSTDLSFLVSNIGSDTIVSFTYTILVNSNTIATNTWNGSLSFLQSTTLNYANISLLNGNNTIEIIISSPNGNMDNNPTNNVRIDSIEAILISETIDIKITLDDYGSETTWEIKNAALQTLYAGGPYSDNTNGTVIQENACLGDGCYQFIIYDSEGDGICCGYGNGNYRIDLGNANLASSNGRFNNSQTKNFCITSASINESTIIPIAIYPNPAKDYLIVESLQNEPFDFITIYDLLGSKIFEIQRVESSKTSIDLSKFSKGTYLIKGSSKSTMSFIEKFIIE